ncbi:protein enabled homolog isoform X1 [Suricata suricatta]|uniref:protein enabled homolog isoform X1 n=1 Tax=Suricata suricatta TaxID=37032 RepID=UPI00115533FA|nr:protein enabled homolog isoform X1 [Suricata suricatta]
MQVRLAPVSSGSGQLGSLTVTPKPEGHTPFAKTVFRPPSQPLLSDPETPPPPNRAPPTRLPPIAPEDTRPGPKAGKAIAGQRWKLTGEFEDGDGLPAMFTKDENGHQAEEHSHQRRHKIQTGL